MLKMNKSIKVVGQSFVNDTQVVYMEANISTDGSANEMVTKNIVNQDIYSKNKTEVRVDMAAFDEEVYKVQDEIAGGTI